jgi:hypothetical protein
MLNRGGKNSVSSQKEAYLYFTAVFFALKIWCSGWYAYRSSSAGSEKMERVGEG